MKCHSLILWAPLLALRPFVSALNPILIKGNVFYDSVTQERFFFVGVDYQPLGEQGVDPLVDPDACARDLFLLQRLGVNVLRQAMQRVYTVDATKNHNECMSIYNAGGIYIMLDVNAGKPGHYLNRDEPYITFNKEYASNVFATMTVFSGYSNVIGFFTGNELINAPLSAKMSPPYLKSLTRYMKMYAAAHLDRPVLLGYSAADNMDYRSETALYMSCGDVNDGRSDFYGINSYQFCGKQDLHTSGYDALVKQSKDIPIPVFFSETGCNQVTPRTFQETDYIFSSDMTSTFSGCLVYEWTQEANNYGLVELAASGKVKLLHDYNALQAQYSKIANLPKSIPKSAPKSVACPPTSFFHAINGSTSLPMLDEIEEVIKKGVDAQPGKLSDVTLYATKYTIIDSTGKEITEKTPKKVSDVSNVDLRPLLKDPAYTPKGTPEHAQDGDATKSASSGTQHTNATIQGVSAASTMTWHYMPGVLASIILFIL